MEDFCCVTIKSLPDSLVRLFHILIHSPHWLLIDSQFSIVSLLNLLGDNWASLHSSWKPCEPPPPQKKKKKSDYTPFLQRYNKNYWSPKTQGCIGMNRYHGWLSIRHLTRQNYVQYSDCRLFKLVIRDWNKCFQEPLRGVLLWISEFCFVLFKGRFSRTSYNFNILLDCLMTYIFYSDRHRLNSDNVNIHLPD